MADSSAFDLLHPTVQRWIWLQRWASLREIQERAVRPILAADRDVVLSAATAAGKTEAAFLPACSHLAGRPAAGIGILYLSPLKALINDQYRRLESLCELLDCRLTAWHGDAAQAGKDKLIRRPEGLLLTTPESLESMLLRRAGWCARAFADLRYVVIDEFHAFLGSERGRQLQSLLHRVGFLTGRTVPRIALSATLGDMEGLAHFLRPGPKVMPCDILVSEGTSADLKVQLRGYLRDDGPPETAPETDPMVDDLYRLLRGDTHLVFADRRAQVEQLAADLADQCRLNAVPNEFFPHHGSLAKSLREGLEARLQEARLPTTAVCTMTLELGIDIGSVDSVAQISAPSSVAGLRQRLGRSGRRGDAAVLRFFIPENPIRANSHLVDRLRLQTVQCIAMMDLLLQKWCEPAHEGHAHLSTLVQQIMSVVGQYGGVRADQLWHLLCRTGPFFMVDQAAFGTLLRGLGAHDLLTQTHDGQLVLGAAGERLVGHYGFFAAFHTLEEYRLESAGRTIGSLPISAPLIEKQTLIFAGKRWVVMAVDAEKKVITLRPGRSGVPPRFFGGGACIHDRVRQEMRAVLHRPPPVYLDQAARDALSEARSSFRALGLDQWDVIELGPAVHVLPWLGDRAIHTLSILLQDAGLTAHAYQGVIDIGRCSVEGFRDTVTRILAEDPPTPESLARRVADTHVDKHDRYVPDDLRIAAYGRRQFDVDGAFSWLRRFVAGGVRAGDDPLGAARG